MRDFQVPTSYRYLKGIRHKSFRCIVLDLLVLKMLEDLPPDKKAFWLEELRMVDTRARAIYDGPQVTQNPQRTISEYLGTSNRPQGHLQSKE